MKLTESMLRQIIREEIGILLEREYYYINRGGVVYHGDDEGNEVRTNKDPESLGLYDDGDAMPTDVPPGRGGYGDGYGRGSYGGGYGYRRRRY